MIKFFENILGITKFREAAEEATRDALQVANDARDAAKESLEEARIAAEKEKEAKMTPKERATAHKKPWVEVLETHVDKENIRKGFFELDWNDEFIVELKKNGYGLSGDNDEDIVDRWFRELCAGVVVAGDYAEFGQVGAGSVDGSSINASK